MRPGVLLPDPVWNLVLVCWMDLQTLTTREMDVEERERQPYYTARPKTVAIRLVFPVSTGELCPPAGLSPSRDDRDEHPTCQVVFERLRE
jgi:hypothetical protein